MIDYTIKPVGVVNNVLDGYETTYQEIRWQLLRFDGKTPLAEVQKVLEPYIGVPVRLGLHHTNGACQEEWGVLLADENGRFGLSEFENWNPDITKIYHKFVDFEIAELAHTDLQGNCCFPQSHHHIAASITTDEFLEELFRIRSKGYFPP
jgi:hypothetical protein